MKATSLAAMCLIACVLINASPVVAQQYQWYEWSGEGGNGHEYAIIFEPADWATQNALAGSAGAHLATIDSQAEQDFVFGVVRTAELTKPADLDYYWMGLFQDPEGAEPRWGWQWLTGELLEYTEAGWQGYANWGFLEPNNQGGEDFGCINRGDGKWNDGKGATLLRAVIERGSTPVDTTPPQTSIVPARPPDADGKYTSPVSVSISATDNLSGVAWTKYSLDGGATWALYSDPVTFDQTGSFTIAAYSQDVAGNVEDPPVELVVVLDLNEPPVADAGEDQTVQGSENPGAYVQLDGSASFDPDGDPLSYAWTWDDASGAPQQAAGASPTVLLPPGQTVVTLVVSDGQLDSEPDTVLITVEVPQDTTPPELSLDPPQPAELWPPNVQVMDVSFSGSVVDAQSEVAQAWLVVDDDYDVHDGTHQIALAPDGSFQKTLQLTAWREPRDKDGRIYLVSLHAVDTKDNVADPVAVTVFVPGKGPGQELDQTPPVLSINSPSPAILPPTGKKAAVTISGNVVDEDSGVKHAWMVVEDEYGVEDRVYNITNLLDAAGDFTRVIRLRASCSPSDQDGRCYEIYLRAEDVAGNQAESGSVVVWVPHDSKSK